MINKKINQLLSSDENLKEQFLENNKSKVNINTNYERVEFDYSWLEKIEEVLVYLDDIIRNPKKFIIQEEEVVPVERAKKITLETVRHLAQHTNYIQKIEDDGTITPNKVLNVHKEESYDIYENRFIYSLLLNLETFMQRRKKVTQNGAFCNVEKKINYQAETKIGSENIKISLNLEGKSFDDLSLKSTNGTVEERIEKIELIISDYFKSPFIKELMAGNIVVVKSPIRKTNVILKNPNFQKALELWEFLEQYDINDKSESKESNTYDDIPIVKDEMNYSFLLDYMILNGFYQKKKVTPEKIRKYYIDKVIRDFINNNKQYEEKEFKKLLNDEFKKIRNEKEKEKKYIIKCVEKEVLNYKKASDNIRGLMLK